MYPKVFEDAIEKHNRYGDISKVPTKNFFYGMQLNEEVIIEISKGKVILVELVSIGQVNEQGYRSLIFKLNGQARSVEIQDKSKKVELIQNQKADSSDPTHIAAPLQGMLSKILVKNGAEVKVNTPLFIIEAMKMETTVMAPKAGKVEAILLQEKNMVEGGDLVMKVS